jgi:hypothetical protein
MGELLNNLRVASPCSADWNQMCGDDRIRHCSQCNLNVYNLSAMSTREAEVLVSQREGRMCVRFYRRKDGTILTQNCPVGWKIALRRVSRRAGIALSAVMATIPIAAQIQPVTHAQPVEGDTGLDIEVIDVQGAACAGARIDLSKSDRHESITATANNAGVVRLAHLAPGTYELTVTFTGFEQYKRTVTIGRKSILLKTTLQVAATIGVMVEAAQVEVPVIESPPALLDPVPIPTVSANRRGFFKRAFGKLFHFYR